MSDYKYPYKDILFSLHHVARIERLTPHLDESLDQELVEAILSEAGKLSEQVMAPLNWRGDQEGSRVENGEVFEPKGYKEMYQAYCEGGWGALSSDVKYGGQGLPSTIATAVNEGIQSANLAFSLCPLLAHGAIEAIQSHASDEIKNTYIPKMVTGQWAGTMNLTEPSAGSDLAAISCKAFPNSADLAAETYLIKGQKIYITWGDHQMSENIIHLVLARLPDAPAGVKGISLFIVPKFLLDEEGNPAERNDISVVSVEHKLGIHASPTCVMSYGDNTGAIGYLVGEPNDGLKAMFTMMNNARQGVGLQGLAISERAYQQALQYAKERKQGMKADRSGRAAIIEHPDVLRMLMTMRSQIDAMRSLVYVAAVENDLSHISKGEEQQAAIARTALLTPIVKGWITELAQEVTSLAIQVHGGMGFIEETGVAQHARDARILPIYEGTNGIQAIDLIGRKLLGDNGHAMTALFSEMEGELDRYIGSEKHDNAIKVKNSIEVAKQATEKCLSAMKDNPILGTGLAYSYMMMMGYVIGGWLLVRAQQVSTTDESLGDQQVNSWQQSADFYCDHILTRAGYYAKTIEHGQKSVQVLNEDSFIR
ncbi:Acyl-CoA dehydrogenase, short-chain specific [Marinomonas spartinae]|uniref:Acyl-CoA dehydrogenase, short-chain specific n=1 Tax=Marinomonas spartinae TaxID=1792290 RepID=A0A1A8TJA5_9GAMM|nr:acyl-CoA dehydrogenase [Marinomonas spartinae]SBS33840.1 Acyl-CoA dehydrogenase, short-chain specific [Marinomonas spartinae]